MRGRFVMGVVLGVACASVTGACMPGFGELDCEEILTCWDTEKGGCLGECVPQSPHDNEKLVLLRERATPDIQCPPHMNEVLRGRTEAPAPIECQACTCTEPACELPQGLTASSAFMCQDGPGTTLTPFEAPAGWDGACVSPDTVPPALFGSMEIAPPTRHPCAPVGPPPVPRMGDPNGLGEPETTTLVCDGDIGEHLCPRSGDMCFPRFDPLPKDSTWLTCIQFDGHQEDICLKRYPRHIVVYHGVDDTRGCTECTCTPTRDGACSAVMSMYRDETCGALITSQTVEEGAGEVCIDQQNGVGLGSMSATWLANDPGACVPGGGEPFGEVTSKAMTYCCRGADQ